MEMEPPRDPRVGTFMVLVVANGKHLMGKWQVMHIGYGEHGFVDQVTRRWVPMHSVIWAEREVTDGLLNNLDELSEIGERR